MNSKTNQKKWRNLETAQKYNNYSSRSDSIYKKTSKDLVNIAEIKEGMTIVDLACGTGITTEEILKRIKRTGKIYAIDASPEMLEIAKKRIKNKNSNVIFINSLAENIDKVVKEKIDRVVSNAAFWNIESGKTFNALNNILKDDGKFIFNLPRQFFIFPKKPKIDLVFFAFRHLIIEIANKKYNFSFSDIKLPKINMFDIKKIQKILKNKFILDFYKVINYERTLKDLYEFNKIPIMAENLLPGLNYKKQAEILDIAIKQVYSKTKINDKWIYFVARKFLKKIK